MKSLLLGSAAIIGLSASAMAADLPSRRAPPPAAYVAVPVFTWTGFYIGANAGYGFSDRSSNGLGALTGLGATATPVIPAGGGLFAADRSKRDGFVGGGQLGYNYQIGSFVLGVEGDLQYSDFTQGSGSFGVATPNANIAAVQPGAPGNVAFARSAPRSELFGTVRGRVGYAFDRVLIFATGGAAFRDVKSEQQITTPFFTSATAAASSPLLAKRWNDVGYTVGGGVEYAFTPNLTGKVEGLYANFGTAKTNVVGVTNTGAAIVGTGKGHDDDFAVIRAGINYKFNAF